MITVVAGGDSFIFGAELADQTYTHSHSTIPALLAKELGADYLCTAIPGNANAAISRGVIDACEANRGKDLLVFVMWTFAHRYEFRFNYNTGRKHTPWYSINLWDANKPGYQLNQQISEFSKVFFQHVGNSEYYETYSSLKEIVFLQNYLELKSIPYLFCPADLHFRDHENYLRHSHDMSMSSLYNQVNWDAWFTFPPGVGHNQTTGPRGFYQWAVENKYSTGPQHHPLEQAHIDAAALMQETFNELVKKHLQTHSLRNPLSQKT